MNERDAIEELAALLDGDGDADNAPASLGGLLTLAQSVRDTSEHVAPTPMFRATLRAELLAAAEPKPTLLERTRAAWARRTANLRASTRVAVATMTASSMIGSAGVAVAAQEALPGDLLYGVKGLTEQARLLLAPDELAEARLHLAFAAERLEELEASAGRLTSDEVVALLDRMDASSQAGAEALLAGMAAGAIDPSEITGFADRQRDGLVALYDGLPLLAKPGAVDSIELLRRIAVNATGVVTNRVATDCDCDDDLTASLPARSRIETPTRTRTRTTVSPETRTGSARLPLVTSIAAPGEGPALPVTDCDCITLPGGSEAREPAREARDESDDRAPVQPRDEAVDEEPEEEPFRPSGPLISPEADGDEDEGPEGPGGLATSVEQLPVGEVNETLEQGTGVDGAGVSDRATAAVTD